MIRTVHFLSGLFKVHRKTENADARPVEMERPKEECFSKSQLIEVVAKPVARPHRQFGKNEQLAYCDDCQEWTPMTWLPIGERGKTAETWFECEYCGGRKLTLKYLSQKEAIRLNEHVSRDSFERFCFFDAIPNGGGKAKTEKPPLTHDDAQGGRVLPFAL